MSERAEYRACRLVGMLARIFPSERNLYSSIILNYEPKPKPEKINLVIA